MKDDSHSPGHGELGELAEMLSRAPSQLQVGQECHLSQGPSPPFPLQPVGRAWQLPVVGSAPASGSRCSISALRDKKRSQK